MFNDSHSPKLPLKKPSSIDPRLKNPSTLLTSDDLSSLGVEQLIDLSIHHWSGVEFHDKYLKLKYLWGHVGLTGNSQLCAEKALSMTFRGERKLKEDLFLSSHKEEDVNENYEKYVKKLPSTTNRALHATQARDYLNQLRKIYEQASPIPYDKIGHVYYLLAYTHPLISQEHINHLKTAGEDYGHSAALVDFQWQRPELLHRGYYHRQVEPYRDCANRKRHCSHIYRGYFSGAMHHYAKQEGLPFNPIYMQAAYNNHKLKLQYLAAWSSLPLLKRMKHRGGGISDNFYMYYIDRHNSLKDWKQENLTTRSATDNMVMIPIKDEKISGNCRILGFNDYAWEISPPVWFGEAARYDTRDIAYESTPCVTHTSYYIPFYLSAIKQDSKKLRRQMLEYPDDFEVWWRSLYEKPSALTEEVISGSSGSPVVFQNGRNLEKKLNQNKQSSTKISGVSSARDSNKPREILKSPISPKEQKSLQQMEATLHEKMESLFMLNAKESDEIGYLLDADNPALSSNVEVCVLYDNRELSPKRKEEVISGKRVYIQVKYWDDPSYINYTLHACDREGKYFSKKISDFRCIIEDQVICFEKSRDFRGGNNMERINNPKIRDNLLFAAQYFGSSSHKYRFSDVNFLALGMNAHRLKQCQNNEKKPGSSGFPVISDQDDGPSDKKSLKNQCVNEKIGNDITEEPPEIPKSQKSSGKTPYSLIYQPSFYFNQIRHPEKLRDNEQYLYSQFFYDQAVRIPRNLSEQEAYVALSVIIPFLEKDSSNQSPTIRTKMEGLHQLLMERLLPQQKEGETLNPLLSRHSSRPKEKGFTQQTQEKLMDYHNQQQRFKPQSAPEQGWVARKWSSFLAVCVSILRFFDIVDWRFTLEKGEQITTPINYQQAYQRLSTCSSLKDRLSIKKSSDNNPSMVVKGYPLSHSRHFLASKKQTHELPLSNAHAVIPGEAPSLPLQNTASTPN